MKKKLFLYIISVCIIINIPLNIHAEEIVFKVQNYQGQIFAVGQTIIDGEIFLPVRSTCELLGYDVYWLEKDRSVKIVGIKDTYTIKVDNLDCVLDDRIYVMEKAPIIINQSTYAPLELFIDIMKLEYIESKTILKSDLNTRAKSIQIENYVNEYRILKNIRALTQNERPAGTKNENDTAESIYLQFVDSRYKVEKQPFKIYANYTKKLPDINRLHIMGIPNGVIDTSIVVNSKNGNIKGLLAWYDDPGEYKDKIIILDTYDYRFYEYLNIIVNEGALGVVLLGEAYDSLMYGLYEENKIVAIGVERSKMKQLRELINGSVKIYAEITVQGSAWHGTSYNVIAKKSANVNPGKEILLITAHYDSELGSVGANDNGSGIGILMEVAQIVSTYTSDLDIWFVALGGNKYDMAGSAYFLSQLDQKTKDRIVGCINLDMLADKNGNHFNIYTVDGRKNIISYFLERSFYKLYGESLPVMNDIIGDHSSFAYAGIPSVLLSQDRLNVEYYNKDDVIDNLSINHLGKTARVICNALYSIMSDETPSIFELNKCYNVPSKKVYKISINALFPFGRSISEVENELGISGYLVPTLEGMAKLKYNAIWFDTLNIPTYFTYDYYGNLRFTEIDFQKADISQSDALKILYDRLGEPADVSYSTYGWKSIYGNYYNYDSEENILTIYPYSPEDQIINVYRVSNRIIESKNEKHQKLWDLMTGLMRSEDIDYISRFVIFTDFLGNKTAYVKRDKPEYYLYNKNEFLFNLDYYDIFDDTGNFRDYNQTVKVLLHEYCHLLTLNKSQMNLNRNEERPIGFDGGMFIEGSYLDEFFKRFWEKNIVYWNNMTINDFYKKFSEDFVSKYAATKASEDICETFVAFILNSKPNQAKNVSEEKILFFYEFDEMVDIRDHVRDFLDLGE